MLVTEFGQLKTLLSTAKAIAKVNEGGRIELNMNKTSKLEFSVNELQMSTAGHLNDIEQRISQLKAELEETKRLATEQGAGSVASPENVMTPANPVFKELSDKVQLLETNRNLKFLLIDGIPETENEKLPELVLANCQGLMQPELKLSDIENAFRLGNKNRVTTKPRTVQVEFVFAAKALKLYQSRMQLARARSNIFISELLTKKAAYLFYLARSNRGVGKPLAKAWTWKGQIYVSKTRAARGTLIRDIDELNAFLTANVPPVPPVHGGVNQ